MTLTFTDVVEQSREAVAADPAWLGSEAHRDLLDAALVDVFDLADASVQWLSPGEHSYWEPATRHIAVERPTLATGLSVEEAAELTALGLAHECLHARYGTPFGSYPSRLQALRAPMWGAAGRLFQVLEDGRICALGARADPELVAPLLKFAEMAALSAAHHAGANGCTATPVSERNQLFFALEVYALCPDKSVTLHPGVRSCLAQLTPLIDRTRAGTTESCGVAAVQLVEALMRSPLAV